MRIPPVALFPMIPPVHSVRRKPDQEEPISFCGHLNRLLQIQRRHLMFQRIICWWSRLSNFAGLGIKENTYRFNIIV